MATAIANLNTSKLRCPSCPNRSFIHAAALLQHARDTGHLLEPTVSSTLKPDVDAPVIMITAATPERGRSAGYGRQRVESPTKLTAARARRRSVSFSQSSTMDGKTTGKENAPTKPTKQSDSTAIAKSDKSTLKSKTVPRMPLVVAPLNESKPAIKSRLTASAKPFAQAAGAETMASSATTDPHLMVREIMPVENVPAVSKTEALASAIPAPTAEPKSLTNTSLEAGVSGSISMRIGNRFWKSFNPVATPVSAMIPDNSHHQESFLRLQGFKEEQCNVHTQRMMLPNFSHTLPAVHSIPDMITETSFTVPVGFKMPAHVRPSLESIFVPPMPVPTSSYDFVSSVSPGYGVDGYTVSDSVEMYHMVSPDMTNGPSRLPYLNPEFLSQTSIPPLLPEISIPVAEVEKAPRPHGFLACPHSDCGKTRLFTSVSALERHFETTGHDKPDTNSSAVHRTNSKEATSIEPEEQGSKQKGDGPSAKAPWGPENGSESTAKSTIDPDYGWLACESCPNKLFSSMQTWDVHQTATGHKFCRTGSTSDPSQPPTTDKTAQHSKTEPNTFEDEVVPEKQGNQHDVVPASTEANNASQKQLSVEEGNSDNDSTAGDKLLSFFSLYPEFSYHQGQPYFEQYRDLIQTLGDNRKMSIAGSQFRTAQATSFDNDFPKEKDYDAWYRLCLSVGINPPPSTVSACRKAIRSIHINLVDFHECWRLNQLNEVRQFGSVGALGRYTRKQKKTISKTDAKEGGLLKYLLRPIYGRRHDESE